MTKRSRVQIAGLVGKEVDEVMTELVREKLTKYVCVQIIVRWAISHVCCVRRKWVQDTVNHLYFCGEISICTVDAPSNLYACLDDWKHNRRPVAL